MSGRNDSSRGLVLFGFKGAGKTTLGQALAQEYEMSFVDTDALFARLYGNPPDRFVELHGREQFNLFESQIVNLLPYMTGVYSTGGGTMMNPKNVQQLRYRGVLVLVDTPKEIIKERLFSDPDHLPTFLRGEDPEDLFNQIYDERMAAYRSIAEVVIGDTYGEQ
jgi:shikimate kinase